MKCFVHFYFFFFVLDVEAFIEAHFLFQKIATAERAILLGNALILV